jgi:act minimal PKS chain-length factor (CLF/KS beta)
MAFTITGIGLISPAGRTLDEHWRNVCAGRTVLAPISRFDASDYSFSLAGELPGYRDEGVPAKVVPQTDVWTRQGLTEAALALEDARLDPAEVPEYRFGVSLASSAGGVEFGQREIEALWANGPRYVGAYQSIAWFYAATTGQTSIRHGLRGQCDSVVAEAAGALDSAHIADRSLRADSDVVLFGGSDSALSPYGMVCQSTSGRLSVEPDPTRAYLPFDTRAAGYVPGEGGAVLVGESDAWVARRAARRYGRVLSTCSTFDPADDGSSSVPLEAAISGALRRAGRVPADIDVVFADAVGVPELDRAEVRALTRIFGECGVPVTAPKAGYGRLYSGGAAVDLATACLAIAHSYLPPTPNIAQPGYVDELDLVHEGRAGRVRTVLVLARGYGGFVSALVLSAI